MGQRLRKRRRQPGSREPLRRDAQHRFSKAIDAERRILQAIRRRIAGLPEYHHLQGMTGVQNRGEGVARSKQAVLRHDAGKTFKRRLRALAVARLARVAVEPVQDDCGFARRL